MIWNRMKLTWACNKSTLSHWFSFSTSRMRKPNMIGSDSKIDFNTKQIELLVWKRLGSFTTWTCLFGSIFVPRNIFNVFPLFNNVPRNVSWYRFLWIVVSVWIEFENVCVYELRVEFPADVRFFVKKNERKKERHGKVKVAKRMNWFVSQTKEKKDSLCFDEEQLRFISK